MLSNFFTGFARSFQTTNHPEAMAIHPFLDSIEIGRILLIGIKVRVMSVPWHCKITALRWTIRFTRVTLLIVSSDAYKWLFGKLELVKQSAMVELFLGQDKQIAQRMILPTVISLELAGPDFQRNQNADI